MDRFVIESPHSAEDCQLVITEVHAAGYLHHFDWGCPEGIHSGWAIIEAENSSQVRMMVPSVVRDAARIVRVAKYDTDEFGQLHPRKHSSADLGS